MFEKLDATQFDWITWRNGTILDVLGVRSRYDDVVQNRKKISSCIVGYCDGAELVCRPKYGTVAVMFLVGEMFFWTHFTKKEFNNILNPPPRTGER